MVISCLNKNPFNIFQLESSLLKWVPKNNFECFFKSNDILANSLKTAQPIECKQILNDLFQEMIEQGRIADSIALLEKIAEQIPCETLQKSSDVSKALESFVKEANLYKEITQKEPSSVITATINSILNTFISLIESFVSTFGVGDFLKPSEGVTHDVMIKSQKFMMLIMGLNVMIPSLGALVVAKIFVSVIVMSFLWPIIKPMTSYLPPGAECWTKQVQKGSLVVHGRKESLDEIAGILKMNRHAILVGPSRVGKSLTAKAFAQAIERGDYPELKGKVVFRFNMADLIDQQASFVGGSNKTLQQISEAMGRDRKDIILVFDEIHMAVKNNQKMADQLKLFLDEEGEFPHVIGITTEEEYVKYVKENQAFSLRFDKVTIENTSQEETLMILGKSLLKNRTHPLVAKGEVLKYIYDKSNQENAPQPASALKLLKKCMNCTEQTQRSPIERKITVLSHKILALQSQEILRIEKNQKIKEEIEALETQMQDLQKMLENETKAKKSLFQAKQVLDSAKIKMYETVLKTSKIADLDKKELNFLTLLHAFLAPFLESHIEIKSKELNLKMVIDSKLVDEMAST